MIVKKNQKYRVYESVDDIGADMGLYLKMKLPESMNSGGKGFRWKEIAFLKWINILNCILQIPFII